MKEKFIVEGMSCAACSASVEKAVKKIDGVSKAEVNLLAKTLFCETDSSVSSNQIIAAVEKAGFSASLASENNQIYSQAKKQSDGFTPVKTRLIISVCFLVILMYFSMGHMINLPFTSLFHEERYVLFYAFSQFLLTLPVLYVNRKFFYSGFRALVHKSPNMDSLVAIGSSAAVVYGVFSIYMIGYGLGSGKSDIVHGYMSNLYFESAAMILTLVTVGKFLEERAKGKTTSSITNLLNLTPKTATVIRNGKEIVINSEDISVGDTVILKPGESVPVDGEIVEGSSSFDQSALTGESIPVDKTIGDSVLSASVNLYGYIKFKALKVGKETTLARIVSLVEDAGASKAPIARVADKVSGVFVPIVMSIALLSVIIWLAFGYGIAFSLGIGISVLVISCPCALGLATPVAITVAMGRSASKGILIKNAEALEVLNFVDTFVFDKTGTITVGKPMVTDIISTDGNNNFVKTAASLESKSEHPLSKAVTEYYKNPLEEVTDFEAVFGKGIHGKIGSDDCFGGNREYMNELSVDITPLESQVLTLAKDGKTPLYFAKGNELLGIIAVSDTIRETSKEAIKKIESLKAKVIMLTGDNSVTANAIKDKLGIDEVISDVLPADKEKIISSLQSQKHIVAMVGDGINDSPALTRADVGIAIGNGSDIAIDSADIVLMKSDLNDVFEAAAFSKKVIQNIKQNLFWAFFYNTLGIPLAAGALFIPLGIVLNPMISAAAMSFSSVFVVTNALRLYKK